MPTTNDHDYSYTASGFSVLGSGSTIPASRTEARIRARCQALADFLVEKNRAYGDSALRPIGIFSKVSAVDLIKTRIDDKLNRIRNRPDAFGEDAVQDLIGYLILLQIAMEGN